jgi:hypothetical protein
MSDSSPRDGSQIALERKNSRKYSPRTDALPLMAERRQSARTLKLERRNSSNSYLIGKKVSVDDLQQPPSPKVSFAGMRAAANAFLFCLSFLSPSQLNL